MKILNIKTKRYSIVEIEDTPSGDKIFRRFGIFKWEALVDGIWIDVSDDIDKLESLYSNIKR